ncbi:hypothetical protein VNO78_11027 [Psophocarpus tetragonolobus]|uniref:Uncharacterized protein n=1 Tax=Psophocarpus tetragonolobus TaxID=3891 RepID=A0AAN9XN93_PSOTE
MHSTARRELPKGKAFAAVLRLEDHHNIPFLLAYWLLFGFVKGSKSQSEKPPPPPPLLSRCLVRVNLPSIPFNTPSIYGKSALAQLWKSFCSFKKSLYLEKG